MNRFRKCLTTVMSLVIAAAAVLTIPAVGLNASAAGINYEWTFDRSSSDPYQRMGWRSNGNTNYSVDNKVHTDNSWFSIKIENTDYCSSLIERTYDVQPKTTYRFSAMVKYSGYQLNPEAKTQNTGACIGKAPYYDGEATYFYPNESGYSTSSDWTLLSYEFTSAADQTTVNLCLQNGGNCKGTAWFSDVKLEKADTTNNWNVLAVFFRNADAYVNINGKNVHHKMSLRDSDINDINKYVLDKLPQTLKTMSNGKITVSSIDRFYVDEALTEKDLIVHNYLDSGKTLPASYNVTANGSQLVSRVLDSYLAKKDYEQILIFVPLFGITYTNAQQNNVWWGSTGQKYKGTAISQISNASAGDFSKDEYDGRVAIHEICHCLETDSTALNSKTAAFHDMYDYTDISEHDWTIRYMNDTLPDGKKGLDPLSFYRANGKYTVVDDDMTTGTGITPGSSSVAPPAPKELKVRSIGDDKVEISWSSVSGVSGYQLGLFTSDNLKEPWVTYDFTSTTTSIQLSPILKDRAYHYGIRTLSKQNGADVYSDWTHCTYTHTWTDVIFGDVDKNGEFNVLDAVAAIDMIINGTPIDQHTLDVMGISGRTSINVTDVVKLIDALLNSF